MWINWKDDGEARRARPRTSQVVSYTIRYLKAVAKIEELTWSELAAQRFANVSRQRTL